MKPISLIRLFLPALTLTGSSVWAQLHPATQLSPQQTNTLKPGEVGKSKPLFTSHVVTDETIGHAVEIDVEVKGAKKLYLVATDGGNGYGADWCDWIEPKIVGSFGEKKLSEIPWVSASSEWGKVSVGKNADGRPMIVNNQPVADGIGTHANSVIEFDLPEGAQRFKAKGGLDKGGVDQGTGTSVVFQVWTTKPVLAVNSGGAGSSKDPISGHAALNVVDGLEVGLFAAEPMLFSPSSIDVDAKGRIWVAEIVNYRSHNGKRPEGDRILILEDTNSDGVADKRTVFYQGKDLISPHGVCVLGNEVIVSAGDKVLRFTDTNGDDKADKTEVMFSGIRGAQHDHGIHAFHFGPDGKLYFNFGNAGEQLLDKDGKSVKDLAGNDINNKRKPYQEGCVFRCNPDLSEVETIGWNFRNNWECNLDSFGTVWQSDNDDDGNKGVRINFVMEFGNYGYRDEMTGNGWQKGDAKTEAEIQIAHWHLNDPGVVPNLLLTGAGSPTGILVYEGNLLPEVFRGQMIHCDPGPNIVRSYPVTKSGAGYKAEIVDMLQGTRDKWFRPSDVAVAPDGSLIVADWYDPGVGGHAMGDLDKGRIYRVAPASHLTAYKSAPLNLTTAEGAVAALLSPNEATRYLAWKALETMGDKASSALEAVWKKDANPRFRARALWALGKLTGRGKEMVALALAEKDEDLRVTGLRLARQLKVDAVELAGKVANDPSAQVRREAAIALRFSNTAAASEVWAKLASQHVSGDAWSLAALGIGANLDWDARLAAYLKLVAEPWNTPAGREIIWISRAEASSDLLAKVLTHESLPAQDRARFVRAFDFQSSEPARQAGLLASLQNKAGDDKLTLELIKRVKGFDLKSASDKVKASVRQYLDANRGSKEYFNFLDRFSVADEQPKLLALAQDQAGAPVAADAFKILLKMGQLTAIQDAVKSAEPAKQSALLDSLVLTQNREAAEFVLACMKSPDSAVAMKSAAVRALGKSRNGENLLLEAVKKNEVPAELKLGAGLVLHASADAAVKKAAVELLPMPTTQGDKPLPSIAELIKRKGDVPNGKLVFAKLCIACHKVEQTGIDFGPALSEIGTKLPKEALYAAILDPNAGISFGYEGVELKTKKGDTYIGFVTGETESEVVIKVPGGITVPTSKAEIAERKKLPASLMPPGLAAAMTEQEFVDLIEYLSSLKKK